MPDPRNPLTGDRYQAGPIILSELQRRVVNEALARKPDGTFKYTTIVYSAPKKSGKSALSSAVALWLAHHTPNAFVACLANDGAQANDRLYGPIYTNFRYHKQLGGIFSGLTPKLGEVLLSNYTKIRAVPCDAAGEAGSQPTGVFYSELWGFDTPKKTQLFTEMTIPPTLYGHAIRWIETYAGYSGVSELLEGIYETGHLNGEPHPDFLDIVGRDGPVVTVNEAAGMFVYWDTEPRMPWQTKEYYRQEAAMLPQDEFRRIHMNQWVSPVNSFIQREWWDACEDTRLPPLNSISKTPVVVGIDMAVSRDCAALVAVSRDPFAADKRVAVRAVRVFKPSESGGVIDQEALIRPVIEDWANRFNVVCWVYDPREMAKLAQDMAREGLGWFKPFGQQQPRAIADKQLYDLILHRQISWSKITTEGDVGQQGEQRESLYKHVTQAGAETRGESYRLVKLSNLAKIDAAVALSQAAHMALKLALDNREMNTTFLIEQLQNKTITLEEFSAQVRQIFPTLEGMIRDN